MKKKWKDSDNFCGREDFKSQISALFENSALRQNTTIFLITVRSRAVDCLG